MMTIPLITPPLPSGRWVGERRGSSGVPGLTRADYALWHKIRRGVMDDLSVKLSVPHYHNPRLVSRAGRSHLSTASTRVVPGGRGHHPRPGGGGGGGGGGRLGINLARMCVSKSEGYGSLFGFKRMKWMRKYHSKWVWILLLHSIWVYIFRYIIWN